MQKKINPKEKHKFTHFKTLFIINLNFEVTKIMIINPCVCCMEIAQNIAHLSSIKE